MLLRFILIPIAAILLAFLIPLYIKRRRKKLENLIQNIQLNINLSDDIPIVFNRTLFYSDSKKAILNLLAVLLFALLTIVILIQVVNFGLYDAFFPVFSGTILLLLIVFSFFPEYSWFGVYVYLRIKFYSNRIEISTKSGRILSTINNSTVDSVDFKPTFSEFYGVKKIDSEYVTFKLIGFMDDSLVCLNDKIRFSHHEILTMNQTLKSHNNQNIKHVSIAFARKNNLRIVNHY